MGQWLLIRSALIPHKEKDAHATVVPCAPHVWTCLSPTSAQVSLIFRPNQIGKGLPTQTIKLSIERHINKSFSWPLSSRSQYHHLLGLMSFSASLTNCNVWNMWNDLAIAILRSRSPKCSRPQWSPAIGVRQAMAKPRERGQKDQMGVVWKYGTPEIHGLSSCSHYDSCTPPHFQRTFTPQLLA